MHRVGPGDPAAAEDTDLSPADESRARPVRPPLGADHQIAAGVHEVQNVLQSVLGWVEMARGTRDPALKDRALKVIEAGVQRAGKLTTTLADPAERLGVRLRGFCVAPVVAEAVELLHPRCAAAGVALAADVGDADAVALGDPDRVAQVLTNLVLNAADAVLALAVREHGRGRVEVAVRVDAHTVAVTVRDDGTGMDAATLARAFEPRFTTHPVAAGRRPRGSGLGLAVSQNLADAMHARLELRSAPNRGTEAVLTLLREVAAAAPSIAPLPDEGELPAGTRVLVVDDEPAIRELLEVALTLRGAVVTAVATLGAARHALAHGAFDVVLVDETLGPHDSGAALLVDLGRTLRGMALVLMTGAPSVDHLPPEACAWLLRKPFSLDEAVRLIGEAVDARD